MAISFIGAVTGSSATDTTSYNMQPLNTSGWVEGDVAVLIVSGSNVTTGSQVRTLSGWKKLAQGSPATDNHTGTVWVRTLQSSDTTTTQFTYTGDRNLVGVAWACAIYGGVDSVKPFYIESFPAPINNTATTRASNTVSNPDVRAWWVVGYMSAFIDDSTMSATADAGTERADVDGSEASNNPHVAIYDSDGEVTTGNKTVTVTSANAHVALDGFTWIGILRPRRPFSGGRYL